MSIPGLTLIGESINDSVPSTHALFEENNLDGIVELARQQAEKGAAYIDVNVGPRSPEFMAEVIRKIQEHMPLPLSIDTPDTAIAAAALDVYDAGRAGNRIPILNSISEARLEMFDLYATQPFMPVLLVTEGMNDSREMMLNRTAGQIHATAKAMANIARQRIPQITNDRILFDPGIMPIGSDSKGDFKRLMQAIGADSSGQRSCRREYVRGVEQLHGNAPLEKGRRFPGERTAGKCISDHGDADGIEYDHRFRQTALRDSDG